MAIAIFEGIVGNLLTTIILGGLVGIPLLIFQRKRILRFYGVRRSCDKILIVVPRLNIQPKGATGTQPIVRGYLGPAVSQPDYEAAVLLQEQIRSNLFSWLSRDARDWLSGKFVQFTAMNPSIDLAPTPDEVESWANSQAKTNLILIGGPVYNAATNYYQKYGKEDNHSQEGEGAHFKYTRSPDSDWLVRSRRVAQWAIQSLSRAGQQAKSWRLFSASNVRTRVHMLRCAPELEHKQLWRALSG